MFKMKVLNQEVLQEVLDMPMVLEAIEKAYTLKAQDKTVLFPMVFHEFNPGVADMDIKSGHLKDVDIFGFKMVSWFGENKEKSLPLLIGTTMIFDSNTGVPLALLNADHITGMRTGAAGAIGAKYLAKKDAQTLLMVGTGHISKFEIAATLYAVPTINKVMIHDPMNVANANRLTENIRDILVDEFKLTTSVSFESVTDLETAVGSSDVIITATPSKVAMIQKGWVKPGTHLSCIGADMSGKQEIDEQLFKIAKVVVDDIKQATDVGETETAYKQQLIQKSDLTEIGDIILGNKPGRHSDQDITIFDSTGIAIQDLITSKLAVDLAKEKNLGVTIDI